MAKRYHEDRPISTSSAESAVDYVIGQRMKKKGHMRWSREGANALLQVRCAVLNGADVQHFKRWYPPEQRLLEIAKAAVQGTDLSARHLAPAGSRFELDRPFHGAVL